MQIKLGDVQKTALIPLVIKANETTRKNPRIHDDMAVKIISDLQFDTRPYDAFMSHEGVIARTIMLDRWLTSFLTNNPESIIVNLGAGFDSRFTRIDNGKITWFDIDYPDSITLREKLFPANTRVQLIPSDILTTDWIPKVQQSLQTKQVPIVFIAEGLFMYLTIEQIKTLLTNLTHHFKNGTIIAEQNSPLMVKQQKHHDTVKNTNAVFKSGTTSAKEIEKLVSGLHLIQERSFNEEMKKYSIRAKIFATLFPHLNDRWAQFEW